MGTVRPGRLEGKVCIVTGAGSSRGIGWATVTRFADEGARHIYAVDINPTDFEALQQTFEKAYPNIKIAFVQADVADEPAIKGLCERAVDENGRLDVFFANAAAFGPQAPFCDDIDFTDFVEILRTNAGGAFLAVKHAPPAMAWVNEASGKVKAGGSIIMTGSTAGLRAVYSMDYSASKAAVHNIALNGARENALRGTGVRVNAVAPGLVQTAAMPAWLGERASRRPDLFCDPVDIANTVLFLASDEAAFVNGEIVAIDNGISSSVDLGKLLA